MNIPAQAAAAEFDESLIAHLKRVPKRELLRVSEVAEVLTVEPLQVYLTLDAGDLEEHEMSHKAKPVQKSLFGENLNADGRLADRKRRCATRVTRRSVVKFLAQSAKYDLSAMEHAAWIGQVLPGLPDHVLDLIRGKCGDILMDRKRGQAA